MKKFFVRILLIGSIISLIFAVFYPKRFNHAVDRVMEKAAQLKNL